MRLGVHMHMHIRARRDKCRCSYQKGVCAVHSARCVVT